MFANNSLTSLSRYQAFVIHLLGSALIASASAALVFFIWYPSPLAVATGVTDIFLLLLLVDVSLGPILTLIVFNPAKKELKWDLLIIASIQMAALIYGLHTVFVPRPVYQVFSVDRFDLVYANDITEEKLAKAKAEFKSLPVFGPQTVAAIAPQDFKARNDLLFSSMSGGDDLPQIPEYYVPYGQQKDQLLTHLQPLDKLNQHNPDKKWQITALIEKYASLTNGAGYLPLHAKLKDMTVIINKDNADVLEVTNLQPW